MGKMNIRSQFNFAINNCFVEHYDRHSAKMNGGVPDHVIAGWNSRNNIKDLANQFAKWLKLEHPDIKKAKQVKSEVVQEFLTFKSESGRCSKETMKTYTSQMRKIGYVLENTFKSFNHHFDLEIPETRNEDKIRNVDFTRVDFKTLMEYVEKKNTGSHSQVGVELSERFAMRVSEVVKVQPRDLDSVNLKLHIHKSKGGRSRDIKITEEDKIWLEAKFEGMKHDQKLVPIKSGSVNSWLHNQLDKLGIDRYKNRKTGIHAIRKMKAQELYNQYRAEGKSKKEALGDVSEYLGHGRNREELMKEYVLVIK